MNSRSGSRGMKMLDMLDTNSSRRNSDTMNRLNLPRYDSSKTSDEHERKRALKCFNLHELHNAEVNVAVSSVSLGLLDTAQHINKSPPTNNSENTQDNTVSSSNSKNYIRETRYRAAKAKRRLLAPTSDEISELQIVTNLDLPKTINSMTNSDCEVFEDSGDEFLPSPYESSSSDSDDSTADEEDATKLEGILNMHKENTSLICATSDTATKEEEEEATLLETKTKPSKERFTNSDGVDSHQMVKSHSMKTSRRGLSKSNEMEEDEIELEMCDTTEEHRNRVVTFSQTKKTDDGKRLRDKIHSCYFCNKMLSNNMARHFEHVHGNDTQVARILAMPKGSKRRREEFENLIRVGDFYHNCNVLNLKDGELILVRRPDESSTFSYSDFGPCSHCLGFMLKKYLWHHIKYSCKVKMSTHADSSQNKGPLNESSALLFQISGKSVSADFHQHIVKSFRSDDISFLCKEDDLILNLGAFLFEKYGTSQVELIRQSMRMLGRLKRQLTSTDSSIKYLKDVLTPQKFDQVIDATKSLCGSNRGADKRNEFGIPSLALKIGYLLRKCIAIERGGAIKKGDIQSSNTLQSFSTVMDIEWSTKISSNALSTMHKKKMNAKQLLPLTSDLLKLSMHLNNQMENLRKQVLESCSRNAWSGLASATLCRIILFNKKRSGEASRMTLENYSSRPSWSEQGTEEFKASLSPMEKELAQRLTVVEIVGKRGRKVPVILTDMMKTCLDVLIKTRKQGEVADDNPYIFARSQASLLNSHLRGHDCLRKECNDAGLVSSENVTSTKLRKYVATVCQIFDLKEHELEWLARHLGHDIRVHRDFYRLHESAIEVTKVSRLLLAVDRGEAKKFAGKQLNDIRVEDLPDVVLESEEENEAEDESTFGLDKISDLLPQSSNTTGTVPRKRAAISEAPIQQNIAAKKKAPTTKKDWTVEEKKSVLTHFSTLIKHDSLPGKQACLECISKYPALKSRKWTDVKFCIKNHITKLYKARSK